MQLGVEFVDLTAVSIPVELASYVPKNIAKKFCVVPVKLVKDTLYLAMSDPLDFVAQEEVKVASRKRVIPMIATRRTTEHAISLLYGSEGTAGVIEEMKREAGSSTPDIVPVQVSQEAMDSGDSAPTIRFVNSLIERAFSERASDIHLEPQDGEMVVRMRIDGLLRRVLTVPSELQSTVISRLKIMGGMNIAEHIAASLTLRGWSPPTICVELTKTDEGYTLKKSEHCCAVWKKKRRCENCISQEVCARTSHRRRSKRARAISIMCSRRSSRWTAGRIRSSWSSASRATTCSSAKMCSTSCSCATGRCIWTRSPRSTTAAITTSGSRIWRAGSRSP